MQSLTFKELREWHLLRNHVRQYVSTLEVCWRCDRVRETRYLTLDDLGYYRCLGGCEPKPAPKTARSKGEAFDDCWMFGVRNPDYFDDK